MLRRLGYEVVAAADGAQALDIHADEGPFDLLMSDIVLPGPNGIEVADSLLARKGARAVLFVSGYTSQIVIPDSDEMGVPVDFLAKPFTLGSLAESIRALLDASSPAEPRPS